MSFMSHVISVIFITHYALNKKGQPHNIYDGSLVSESDISSPLDFFLLYYRARNCFVSKYCAFLISTDVVVIILTNRWKGEIFRA